MWTIPLSCDVCLHPHQLSSVWPSQSPLHSFLPQKPSIIMLSPEWKTERRLLKKGLPFPVYSKVLLNTCDKRHTQSLSSEAVKSDRCVCERDTIPVLSATVDFQSLLKVRQAPDNNRVASFLFISHVALWFLSALSENISELCVFRACSLNLKACHWLCCYAFWISEFTAHFDFSSSTNH